MTFLAFCFVALGALYIYGINKTIVQTFGISADTKHITAMEEEIRALESERANLAVGSRLEARARQYALVAQKNVYILSRDTSLARAE